MSQFTGLTAAQATSRSRSTLGRALGFRSSPQSGGAGRRRAIYHGLVLGGLIFLAYIMIVLAPIQRSMGFDAYAYWSVDLANLYRGEVGDLGFFAYSPALGLLFLPLTVLPWLPFALVWWGLLVGALLWLGRGSFLALLAFPPVAYELYHANIHLLLAVAIVLGMRYPAAWAFVLLTKITAGVGLLWFVVRREWRQLFVALGATGIVVGATYLLLPAQWAEWFAILTQNAGHAHEWPALPIPLWLRLPVAALIVAWGARRDARWTVPLAATLALPVLWAGGLSLLVACWALRSPTARVAIPTDAH
ncbi:MAG TPA: glycosyltransferase family 87 protein [Candidatus Limnocylindria bacterium]|nr:glycosyltransferase family 87 protein [Candidatus Limnocylindria bacterium]